MLCRVALRTVRDESLVVQLLLVAPLDEILQRERLCRHIAKRCARETNDDRVLSCAQQLTKPHQHEHALLVAQDLAARPHEIVDLVHQHNLVRKRIAAGVLEVGVAADWRQLLWVRSCVAVGTLKDGVRSDAARRGAAGLRIREGAERC